MRHCKNQCSVDLNAFFKEWVEGVTACPTIKANFAYSKRKYVAELVVVTPPLEARDAQLTAALCVGWAEPDSSDGALAQQKFFPLPEGQAVLSLVRSGCPSISISL